MSDTPSETDNERSPVPASEDAAADGPVLLTEAGIASFKHWSRTAKMSLGVVVLGLLLSLLAGRFANPRTVSQVSPVQTMVTDEGGQAVIYQGEEIPITDANVRDLSELNAVESEDLATTVFRDDQGEWFMATRQTHLGPWSFLPAVMAVALCLLLKEPLIALLGGVFSGGFLLRQYNITDEVLMPSLASPGGAGILLLYLWLLGALMGIWSRNGAAEAFAQFATKHFVRGPKTAKLVAWGLGVLFFQGGTISTVLVGTTVKPVADKQRISHEELSYIVDSTASPIAILLAFNAWPLYVQALLFVPGVAYLATETERLEFFFRALPMSFYAWFAVLGTFLISIDRAPLLGKRMREAIRRSRETGELDRPGSDPMLSAELQSSRVPEGYTPSIVEFVLPMVVLIGLAVGTFLIQGSPQVRVAFGVAALTVAVTTLARGMPLKELIDGIGNGLKGVVVASVILLLAVTLGSITQQTGAAGYLVALLGDAIPHWLMPGILFLLTVGIAFSTGTSWGTYAVAFPLAMPLAVSIASTEGLANPERFVAICFASVLNGSVMGDQCSPISDTTVLSSMTTGADLMDHVLTQIVPATAAGILAVVLWTGLSFTC
ncbi:MAG: Na+/H+ antiporter NhaC family protein [Planctomycetota bacterium]